jgi:hypothetical protein
MESLGAPHIATVGGSSPDASESRRREQRIRGRILIGLLAFEAFLLACDSFRWFGFDEHKGWTVSMAVLSVVAAAFLAFLVRRPRWHQFSLRSLLIFTVIVAVASAWLRSEVESKRQEREAVAAIVQAGGTVDYDYQWDYRQSGQPGQSVKPPGPGWLRGLLGENFFARVRSVSFDRMPGADVNAVAPNLDRIAGVRYLYFNNSNLADDGLAHVKGMSRLEVLYLDGTKISDAGLANLQGLWLIDLGFRGTNISNAALPVLKSMRGLHYLDLKETRVSKAGAEDLKNALPNCFVDFR